VVTEPIRAQYPVHAVLGTEIAGLRKDGNPKFQAIENEFIAEVRAQSDLAGATLVKLDDPKAKDKPVILMVVTTLILDPDGELDRIMAGIGDGTLGNVQDFDAHPRGGQLRCAHTRRKAGKDFVVCGWIDHGSVGIAAFLGGWSIADSARVFREIRTEILVKGRSSTPSTGPTSNT
jgi:hypothetical protein